MKTKKIKAYMCGIAWQEEIGNTDITLYPSIKELKNSRGCSDDCGIVEVEIKLFRWVKKQKPIKDWT